MRIGAELALEIRSKTGINLHAGLNITGIGSLTSKTVLYGGSDLHNIQIGGYSYFSPLCEASFVSVGNYSSIAKGFAIGLGHRIDLLTTSPVISEPWLEEAIFQPLVDNTYKHSKIGSDVWIGNNVNLIAGVNIGDGAIIGAGSVVSKDVPPFVVAAGNPCRIIRERFTNDVLTRVLRNQWYLYDFENKVIEWNSISSSLDSIEKLIDSGSINKFEKLYYEANEEQISISSKSFVPV